MLIQREWVFVLAELTSIHDQIGTFAFLHNGQVCFCIKRIYVHKDIYDTFLAALVEFVKTLKGGGPADAEAHYGPTQNAMQCNKLLDLYVTGAKEGWKFALGGDPSKKGNSFFLPPIILDNPPEHSRVVVVTKSGSGPLCRF